MSQTEKRESDLFRAVFDASPTAMLLVDDDVVVRDYNRAAGQVLGGRQRPLLMRRGGEILHCLHAFEDAEGCGRAEACQFCVVRYTVVTAHAGNRVVRRTAAMELVAGEKNLLCTFLVSAAPFDFKGSRLVLLSMEDITEVIALRRLLPICANCKKIRDDENYWVDVEKYFERYLGTEFTHGICPHCARQLYPEMVRQD